MSADFLTTYEQAQKLIASGDLRAAADLCRTLLETDPRSSHGHYLMSRIFLQSGHLKRARAFADRAVEYAPQVAEFELQRGKVLQQQGEFAAAEQSFLRVLGLNPDYSHVQGDLFNVLIAQQKYNEALSVLGHLLRMAPSDPSLHHMLASLEGRTTGAAPPEFIAALFDQAAESYDYHMLHDLSYRTPLLLAGAIRAVTGQDTGGRSLLDLGCGTGLAAEALQDMTARRIGVDLSENMLARAHTKLLYAELYRRDMIEFLRDNRKTYDLVTAADALVYTGSLVPLFNMVRGALAPDALFAFSVERDDSTDAFRLHVTGRYGHSAAYVQSMLYNDGYELLVCEDAALRTEDDKPVRGLICVARVGGG